MFKKLLSVITGAPLENVAEYFQKKQELKHQLKLAKLEGQIEVQKAKTQMEKARVEQDNNWELKQIQNSGWKDEFVLILLAIPLIMAFIPFLTPYVTLGFHALSLTPPWYRWLIMLVFTAIYGIRIWRRKVDV